MFTKTTLNINIGILEKISKAAEHLRISRTKVIIILLHKIMRKDKINIRYFYGVRYQEAAPKEMWHPFHIRYRDNEFRYFNDLRNFHRCSLSYLLRCAVEEYMNELLFGDSRDNYVFNNYVCVREIVDGVIGWRIFWGIPDNLEQILPSHPT